jgi:hypothetical protein
MLKHNVTHTNALTHNTHVHYGIWLRNILQRNNGNNEASAQLFRHNTSHKQMCPEKPMHVNN